MSRQSDRTGRAQRPWITGPEIKAHVAAMGAEIERGRSEFFRWFAENFERERRAQIEAFVDSYSRAMVRRP